MNKTIFDVKKMDCPSEERLIRMKLDSHANIVNLNFDIANRKLTVIHHGAVDGIDTSMQSLNLGAEIDSSESINQSTSQAELQKHTQHNTKKEAEQRKLLWMVLAINATFFVVEMTTGLLSHSMGLVADSLDMLADSFVYGMSLFAVTSSAMVKKRVAKLAGYLQMTLAIIGFVEVLRLFFGYEQMPDFATMIVVSVMALIANVFCLYLLQKSQSNDEAHMQASMIFTSNDVIINVGVIVAALFVNWLHSSIPDLLIGSIVFVLVMQGAYRILKL